MAFKFPISQAWVGVGSGDVLLSPDQVWDADSDAVLAHPAMFADEPTKVHGRRTTTPVEQATAGPGERRNTRRGN